ncbi:MULTISPECIES: F0F1 ATP synthase subunit epsilon [unclassified Paenibacillus]|jgi:F-type H+-transporting ATPase subunit epsilon|uniref:F0F1 ATP synthase subunit epsilon n=1 Tax=Paenibacillaceae TaxID=186822 RepID=UPI0028100A02|nr:F0F1 ATP synthase subunit epsilon [Paenibacillus sp. LHD-38]MDQ8734085.1 F0F1 ATP synthase subunit epsilon [Paenibacillus sp. LHD-38]
MSSFLVEIVTPERKVYAETANMVSVTGVEGELGILPNHIPLVTPLRIAPVVIKRDNNKADVIAVNGGFIEVRKDKIVILAESAELATDINIERAEAAKQRAQQRLAAKQDQIDFRRAELALQRAMNRLNVKQK